MTLKREEDRRVIPRWRDTRVAGATGEAASLQRPQSQAVERAQQRVAQHLSRLQEAFLSRPSVGRAAELTGAAALAARPEAAGDAAEFLLMHAEDTTPMALTAARRVIGLEALHLEEVAEGPAGVDAMQGELRRLRAVIREGSRSPFAHLDLARVYSTLGQRERAERHLSIALALAPQNRLILREIGRASCRERV